MFLYKFVPYLMIVQCGPCLLQSRHDTQHEKSMTLIRQENNDLSTNLK